MGPYRKDNHCHQAKKVEMAGTCTENGHKRHAKIAISWTPDGERKRGRPKEICRGKTRSLVSVMNRCNQSGQRKRRI